MCLGEERQVVRAGQAAYIPPGVSPQLTNLGETAAADALLLRSGGRRRALKQELSGTLPVAGIDVPRSRPAHARNARKNRRIEKGNDSAKSSSRKKMGKWKSSHF